MIKTFADCPFRREHILELDEVLKGLDYRRGLCPDRCPVSPRNADYSRCKHPDVKDKRYKHCPAFYRLRPDMTPDDYGYSIDATWCEVNTNIKKCPMGYAR